MRRIVFTCLFNLLFFAGLFGQGDFPSMYNPVWLSQSENSSESMPVGGGDIGLNVWFEGGDLLFYVSRSGTFDENNEFVKLGRVRVKFSPNPFNGEAFRQELVLKEGYLQVKGEHEGIAGELKLWADVFHPSFHLDISSSKPIHTEVIYESWRSGDLQFREGEAFANSYKWETGDKIRKRGDSISFVEDGVLFFHRNKAENVFMETLRQQELFHVKERIPDPITGLTFGGIIYGDKLERGKKASGKYIDTDYDSWSLQSKRASKSFSVKGVFHTAITSSAEEWIAGLDASVSELEKERKKAGEESRDWWNAYWDRSYIQIEGSKISPDSKAWQVGRNYQLFRYMLGCNAYGSYPTKFNGGLFTYDPRYTDPSRAFTPDYRNWGGGTFTAQNQRLVYFPMLKSGDFNMMDPQLDFYKRLRDVGELRSEVYWGHGGVCLTEQLENFGLPNRAEYGLSRPEGYDPGLQYNAWLEYQWDTSLEICLMILERWRYNSDDPGEYLEFIMGVLRFFDEHYQYLAGKRGIEKLDQNGKLVLYPGSGCETYKMAYNSTATVAGLKVVIEQTLALPENMLPASDRDYLMALESRIPELEFRELDGKTLISPARTWERVNNTEAPQLYPVYPWGLFGVGKPGLDTAINTYLLDPDVLEFRNHISWKQYGIWAARLGLEEEAWKYAQLKLTDSGRRFPAFWGPGFDWVPDHNWGGSGMIGLQEMLLQDVGEKIYLFPAWPEKVDVRFKLHAPGNTVVEAEWKNGEGRVIEVSPEERRKDVILLNN